MNNISHHIFENCLLLVVSFCEISMLTDSRTVNLSAFENANVTRINSEVVVRKGQIH